MSLCANIIKKQKKLMMFAPLSLKFTTFASLNANDYEPKRLHRYHSYL